MLDKKILKKGKGFTLIEIAVSIGIFLIILISASGILVSAIKNQRRNLSSQEILSQTSYALEYMSRAMRMAKKDDLGGINCLLGDKINYEITHSGQGIKFLNSKDECQEFFLENGQLKENKDGNADFLTSDNFLVNSFNIAVSGQGQTDELQPKATIFLDIQAVNQDSPARLKIQTTVSQRNLDVKK